MELQLRYSRVLPRDCGSLVVAARKNHGRLCGRARSPPSLSQAPSVGRRGSPGGESAAASFWGNTERGPRRRRSLGIEGHREAEFVTRASSIVVAKNTETTNGRIGADVYDSLPIRRAAGLTFTVCPESHTDKWWRRDSNLGILTAERRVLNVPVNAGFRLSSASPSLQGCV